MAAEKLTIAVPLHRREDRRAAERFVASMPASVNGGDATTQDLSASGLSFVTDRAYQPGERIEVTIEYLLDGHHYPLQCEAEVVRVQQCPQGYTIGARLAPEPQRPALAVPAEPGAPLRAAR